MADLNIVADTVVLLVLPLRVLLRTLFQEMREVTILVGKNRNLEVVSQVVLFEKFL